MVQIPVPGSHWPAGLRPLLGTGHCLPHWLATPLIVSLPVLPLQLSVATSQRPALTPFPHTNTSGSHGLAPRSTIPGAHAKHSAWCVAAANNNDNDLSLELKHLSKE